MINLIFSIVSIAFVVIAVAIGALSAAHVRRNRNELRREFGQVMSCPTGKLKRYAADVDRQTDENLQTQGATKVKRLTFSDVSRVT